MRPEVASAVEAAIDALGVLDLADAFDPGAPAAIVAAGLHRLCVPAEAGGSGATLAESAEALAAIGAVDGSTALGLAMQTHVVGAMRDSASFSPAVRAQLYAAIVDEGALVNNAATEEGGGSPARGAIPGTVATGSDAAGWHLRGEKTWTTWLPALRYAFVTAQLTGPGEEAASREVGTFLVDLAAADGVDRQPAFAALGMRGSASGRLILDGTPGVLVQRRPAGGPTRVAQLLARGSPSRSAPRIWASARAPGAPSPAGRSIAGPAMAAARWPTSRPSSSGSGASMRTCARPGSSSSTRPVAGTRRVMAATRPWPSSWPRALPRPRPTRRCASPVDRASSPDRWSGPSATPGPGSSTHPLRTSPCSASAGPSWTANGDDAGR